MFKLKCRKTPQAKPVVKSDLVVCRIKVYNRAISAPVADVTFRQSERHLIGAFKFLYPTSQYRLEVTYY